MKKSQTPLPRFVVGTLATIGASTANSAVVQITFANNIIANTAGGGLSSFTSDFTGDGIADVAGHFGARAAIIDKLGPVVYRLGGAYQDAINTAILGVIVGNVYSTNSTTNPKNLRALADFKFTDARINGGATTLAWADITAIANSSQISVQVHRIVFNDANTSAPAGVVAGGPAFSEFVAVPEPSSLGLLALGAGGILLRRRRSSTAA